jgi:autotransporter adhesin
MMWYPARAAFRAGYLNASGSSYWDVANVGHGSVAFGENTRAEGRSSFAAGLSTRAAGDQSIALGSNSTASGDRSLAVNGTATATSAVAVGNGAQATGSESVALGSSSIAGGLASTAMASAIANGTFAIAMGQQSSASGNYSVAIGRNARTANRSGSIVLGDACAGFSSDSIYPTANNQFVVRGCGGIQMYTSQNLSAGVQIAVGGSSWSSVSDRNRKENFLSIDGEEVLERLRAVPVTSWNYRTQERDIRHLGPMAQDFHAAFGLGESDLLINSIDIDGVNLAAVKALTERTEMLSRENAELRARLERLEARLESLDSRSQSEDAGFRPVARRAGRSSPEPRGAP